MINDDILYDWSQDKMIEITLGTPDDFLKIKETLTRIGIASKKTKMLYQTAHILHKKNRYYIVHFKELFLLDQKRSDITLDDVARRNRIIALLADWNLCSLVNASTIANQSSMSTIKIVPYQEKQEWTLCEKYHVGRKQ